MLKGCQKITTQHCCS